MTHETQLIDLFNAPFRNDLENWGRVLCVAPHPDDESLGCGGTLARLSQVSPSTTVVWVSDGSLSHPNSQKYPRPQLAKLREKEALSALVTLGLEKDHGIFQRLLDGSLPFPDEPGFSDAVASAKQILEHFQPDTLLLPWRRDPHRDHRAAWSIWTAATENWELRRLEYLVWAFERASAQEMPSSQEACAFRVDVSPVLEHKRAAINAHQSQTTHLIDDDVTGFWLSPEVIAHFEKPFEIWIEPFQSSENRSIPRLPDFESDQSPVMEAVH